MVWLTTDFPDPDSPDQRDDGLRAHPERHAGDGADEPARCGEANMEIADLKKIGHSAPPPYTDQCRVRGAQVDPECLPDWLMWPDPTTGRASRRLWPTPDQFGKALDPAIDAQGRRAGAKFELHPPPRPSRQRRVIGKLHIGRVRSTDMHAAKQPRCAIKPFRSLRSGCHGEGRCESQIPQKGRQIRPVLPRSRLRPAQLEDGSRRNEAGHRPQVIA